MKIFFLLSLFVLFFTIPLHGEEKILHVGISTGYPPFYFYDEQHKPVGLCIDVLNSISEELNISIKYSSYPWKRMIRNGREGYVDAIMPLFRTPEREEFLIFPETDLVRESNSFFTLSSSPLRSGDLYDIGDRHIGVIENYSYGEEFDKKNISHKTVAQSEEQLIQLVLHERIDMGIGNTMVVSYFAAQSNSADKIRFLSPPVTESPLHIGFSKKNISADFVKRFDKALHHFKTTKEYSEILDRYQK